MTQPRIVLAIFCAALAAFGRPSETAASDAGFLEPPPERMEEYALPNGLKVILLPDSRTPKVALELRYDVGSTREPPGLSGFSHLFEHLMFMGTPAAPNFDGPLAAAGVSANAFTSEDGVRYQMEGPSAALPLMLAMEADRMANLGPALDQEDLNLQREVVLNELRQNVMDAPGYGPQEALAAALYPQGHPYQRPVIGSVADLEAATLEDARRFFDLYYRPSNAILALAGDFQPEDGRRLVAESFGLIPLSAPLPPVVAPPPFAPQRARLELEDALPSVAVTFEWTGPPIGSEGDEALRVAALALSDDSIGVLRRKLVLERGVASQAASLWTPLRFGGRFAMVVTGAEGVGAAELEAQTRAAVEEIRREGLPAPAVRAAAQKLASEMIEAEERLAQRARTAVDARLNLGSAGARRAAVRRLSQIDAPKADAALRAVTRLEDASIGITLPGPRGGLPEALVRSTGGKPRLPPPERAPVAVAIPAPPEAPRPPLFPEPHTAILPNGLRLEFYRREGAAFAYLALIAPGGEAFDPRGREGLVSAMAEMVGRDHELSGRLASMGAAASANLSATHAAALLSGPLGRFEAAVKLFAPTLMTPKADPALWSATLARRRLQAGYAEVYAPSLAARIVKAEFYGPEAREGRSETLASLADLTLEEAMALHGRIFRPDGALAVMVADMPPDEAERLLVASFGGWRGAAPRPPEFWMGRGPQERRLGLGDSQGAAQAAFTARIGGAGRVDPSAAAEAAARVLGGGFVSRLNRVLREEKGYTYSASGGLIERGDAPGVVWIDSSFDATVAAEAVEETWRILESLRTQPITEDELAVAKLGRLREDLDSLETTRGLFGAAVWENMDGRSLAKRAKRSAQMSTLPLAAAQAAGAQIATAARVGAYGLAGDAERLEADLRARGAPFVFWSPGGAQGDAPEDDEETLRDWEAIRRAACAASSRAPSCAPAPAANPRR